MSSETPVTKAIDALMSFIRDMNAWEIWAADNDPDPDLVGIDTDGFTDDLEVRLGDIFKAHCKLQGEIAGFRLRTHAYRIPPEYEPDQTKIIDISACESGVEGWYVICHFEGDTKGELRRRFLLDSQFRLVRSESEYDKAEGWEEIRV